MPPKAKTKKIELGPLMKKCFGSTKIPDDLKPDLEEVLKNKRVDLFPSNYGLGVNGTPIGGFYTFVNDPKAQQRFFRSVAHVFSPMEIPVIVGDLFPDSCFVDLTYLRSVDGKVLPPATRITGRGKISTEREMENNEKNIDIVKRCLAKGTIARVALKIVEVDSEGNLLTGHAIGLVFHPTSTLVGKAKKIKKGEVEVTVLDPSDAKSLEKSLGVIKHISDNLGKGVKIYPPTYTCRSSFQGNTDLCATWALFLLLTHIVNPPSWWPRIEADLLSRSNEETDRLIYQFAWWFRKVFGTIIYEGDGTNRTYEEVIDNLSGGADMRLPKVSW